MKKFVSRKKTCYINLSNTEIFNTNEIRNIFNALLQKGFSHFFFSIEQEASPVIKYLLRLQSIYKNISVFVVHNSKTPYWSNDKITNLPIFLKQDKNEKEEINAWLEKYCEFDLTEATLSSAI